MTRSEEIAVIEKCRKSIYNRLKYLKRTGGATYKKYGLVDAEFLLQKKRRRLEKKLK